MNDFKLKVVIAALTGVVFSFIFVLLAFVLPSKPAVENFKGGVAPSSKLQKISQELRKHKDR